MRSLLTMCKCFFTVSKFCCPVLYVDANLHHHKSPLILLTTFSGYASIFLPDVKHGVTYNVWVEHRDAAWAQFQGRRYKGGPLWSSGARVSVWTSMGVLVDRHPMSLSIDQVHNHNMNPENKSVLWWNVLKVNGTSRQIELCNNLTSRRPGIADRKARKAAK